MKNMQKFNFSYDRETDDLFLFNQKSKSKGSIEFGDLILDYSSKKELVGIQIMNASAFIKDMINDSMEDVKNHISKMDGMKLKI